MRSIFALALFALIGVVGCDDTSKVETQQKVTTPDGTTTRTVTDEVQKTGDHKP